MKTSASMSFTARTFRAGAFGSVQVGTEEARMLFTIYGGGYAAVFLVFTLLYAHAWRERKALALDGVERLLTCQGLVDHAAMMLVGLISVGLAWLLPSGMIGIAGYFYFIVGVYFTISGTVFGRKERLLVEASAAGSAGN